MSYQHYQDKEKRKGYLKDYMRDYRAHNRKQLLELKHEITALETILTEKSEVKT